MYRIDGPGATVDNKFTEGDPVAGIQATVVTDDFLNDVQEELMSVLTAAGVAPVKGTQDQVFKSLAKLLQSQKLTAFTTAGTATVLTLAPSPAIDALEANQRFRVKFSLASGANPTLNVSGKGAKNLKQYDTSGAKVAAVVAAGQLSDIEYDGTDWVILEKKANSTGVTQGKLDNSTNLATTAFAQSIGFRFNENIVITAAASLTASAHAGSLVVGASASPFTLTLPAAATMPAGTAITFLNYGAGILSVVAAGADIIQNPFANIAALAIPTNSFFVLVSTGATGWYVAFGSWSSTETVQGVARIATQAQTNAGTDDATIVTPKKLQPLLQAITSAAFGAGQTWQDVTGSRVIGTTYTNSTSRSIAVSVNSANGTAATLSVNGVQVSRTSQSTGGLGYQLSAIVPVGGTYVYNTSTGNLTNWAEFK